MGSIPKYESDVLIVGAGIFGTSTAYHLALSHVEPSRVTVLDRAPCPSPQAASSDINKIVRADYTSPFYMDLAYEAMDAWATWAFLKDFYHRTGWLMMDERGSDIAARIQNNFRESGRPDTSEDVSLDDVKTRWDGIFEGMDMTEYDKAYTNSGAGWADASLAVEAMMKEAMGRGVKYEVGEVQELLTGGSGLDGVRTSNGNIYTAKKILLATGAWTPWLMLPMEEALQAKDADKIEHQISSAGVCCAAFKVFGKESTHFSKMPVLIYGAKGEVMPPNREGWFKFTNANTFTNYKTHPLGQKISVPSEKAQDVVPEKLKQESIELIRQRLPQMLEDGRLPDDWRLCWDAVSPDQNQLICQHPDPRLSNLYFATAGSFHSWKFLPTIGKYVVNVLQGKSNGKEKDDAWQWKRHWNSRGAHEKVKPNRDLQDLE